MSTDAGGSARMWGVLTIIGAIFVAQLVVVPWQLGIGGDIIYAPAWMQHRQIVSIDLPRLALQLGATLAVALAWIFYATRDRKAPSTDAGSASEPERLE